MDGPPNPHGDQRRNNERRRNDPGASMRDRLPSPLSWRSPDPHNRRARSCWLVRVIVLSIVGHPEEPHRFCQIHQSGYRLAFTTIVHRFPIVHDARIVPIPARAQRVTPIPDRSAYQELSGASSANLCDLRGCVLLMDHHEMGTVLNSRPTRRTRRTRTKTGSFSLRSLRSLRLGSLCGRSPPPRFFVGFASSE